MKSIENLSCDYFDPDKHSTVELESMLINPYPDSEVIDKAEGTFRILYSFYEGQLSVDPEIWRNTYLSDFNIRPSPHHAVYVIENRTAKCSLKNIIKIMITLFNSADVWIELPFDTYTMMSRPNIITTDDLVPIMPGFLKDKF